LDSDSDASDTDSDEEGYEQYERQRYSKGGWKYLKEEDWVTWWWRKHNEEKWVEPFLTTVEELSIVSVNATMVERMWSVFGASFPKQVSSDGPCEREQKSQARFKVMYSEARAL
jgi:hypothetical protein